jgi:mannose-6-phosphate isomerase
LSNGATQLGAAGTQSWFMPLGGAGMIGGQPWSAGQCWLLDGAAALDVVQSGKALLATL